MILRRVIAHFRKQEWTAIFLDFVIVVVGVFVGIQVSNWNAARSDERTYQQSMERLAEENAETLREAATLRLWIDEALSDVQPAIDILKTCQTSDGAVSIVEQALNRIRAVGGVDARTLAIDQLVSDDQLIGRQSDEARAVLRSYHASLHDINETSSKLAELASVSLADTHPFIGFTDLVDPSQTLNKVDLRRAVLSAPLDEACRDPAFRSLFYKWERPHVFILSLIDRLEDTVSENSTALGLPDPRTE